MSPAREPSQSRGFLLALGVANLCLALAWGWLGWHTTGAERLWRAAFTLGFLGVGIAYLVRGWKSSGARRL